MPPAPPQSRPQTLKQAKAAFKSRGQVSFTEKEKRQLDRAVELDRRAWRTKETEKRKAEAAKKKSEKERKQREELETVRLGSQRRCDRFGYKSSQMHLGAFLSKGNTTSEDADDSSVCLSEEIELGEDCSFGDDDLDDETLLEVLDTAKAITTTATSMQHAVSMNPHPIYSKHHPQSQTTALAIDDIESLWEALESNTQIARDISSHAPKTKSVRSVSPASSFGSDGFGLTIEDMEQLDPPPIYQSKSEEDRKLMPPPPLPQCNIKHEPEFTMSQLESFLEDDLELTQADHG